MHVLVLHRLVADLVGMVRNGGGLVKGDSNPVEALIFSGFFFPIA